MINVLLFLIPIFAIIPIAFVPIWIIFKLTEKLKWRILSTAFFIPLVNFIWFFIEGYCCPDSYVPLSLLVAYIWLFAILPVSFLIILCIPKKYFQIKWKVILTILLTEVFGWLLAYSVIPIWAIRDKFFTQPQTSYYNLNTLISLKDYDPAIKYIENYKSKNGKYPKNINTLKIKSENYPNYKYITYNNNKDFVLLVSDYELDPNGAMYGFRYCSSEKLPDCKAIGYKDGNNSLKIGKWVYLFDDD